MRNIRMALMCGWMILTLLPMSAKNFVAECGGHFLEFTVLDEDQKTCATYRVLESAVDPASTSGTVKEVLVLPERVTDGEDEYTIVSIGEKSFYHCQDIDILILPETVTTIEYEAFHGSGISSFHLPYGLRSIESSAFGCCMNLKAITIPPQITSLPRFAFDRCFNLEVCNMAGVSEIGDFAFDWCESLTLTGSLENLKQIGEGAFESCESISTLDIPNVVEMGARAFNNCTGLTKIQIPSGMEKIEKECFRGCTSLSRIDIPDNIERIETGAFRQCSSLEEITISPSVNAIGPYAFADCDDLSVINVNRPVPPTASLSSFSETTYHNARLIVPTESAGEYQVRNRIWSLFANLETGMDEVNDIAYPTETGRYTTTGIPVDANYKGLVLVRYADGSSRKVVVK